MVDRRQRELDDFRDGTEAEKGGTRPLIRNVVRRLWKLKLIDGAEVSAVLYYDSEIGEAVVELTVQAAAAEDVLAMSLADGVKAGLIVNGATEM